jgi:hypothetical protein
VARLTVPDDETLVEVPAALLNLLALDGLDGEVTNVVPPIVGVTPRATTSSKASGSPTLRC